MLHLLVIFPKGYRVSKPQQPFYRITPTEAHLKRLQRSDSADLARAISEVLDDDARRARMAADGHERAREYDWSAIADRVLQVYDTVRMDGEKIRRT